MKITICGSLKFVSEMHLVKLKLEKRGHKVLMPESAIEEKDDTYWNDLMDNNPKEFAKIKGERIKLHFDKIKASDAILILNYDKHGKNNYVGPNTFLEMGYAFGVGKKIFVLNHLPKDYHYEELISMNPVCLNNDLEEVK